MVAALSSPGTSHEPSDAALLRRSDEASLRVLFDRHAARIHRFAVLRVGPDEADDLVSEVFATAWVRRDTFDANAASALPWLYGIAANVIKRHRATEARWHASVAAEVAVQHIETEPDLPAPIDPELVRAIASLAPSERDVLLLVAVSEMTTAQAAQTLGTSAVAARVRLHRARRRLADILDKDNA